MTKKAARTAPTQDDLPQPVPVPVPPGGGRWKWDEAEGKLVPNDQPKTTQTQE